MYRDNFRITDTFAPVTSSWYPCRSRGNGQLDRRLECRKGTGLEVIHESNLHHTSLEGTSMGGGGRPAPSKRGEEDKFRVLRMLPMKYNVRGAGGPKLRRDETNHQEQVTNV